MIGTEDRTARRSSGGRYATSRQYHRARLVVAGLAVAAAAGGAVAGCHPTGVAVLDVVYPAALAALVTLAASRASRASLLWLTVIGVGLSRSWLWIPAGAALALAFSSAFQRRAHMRLTALTGALAAQVLLRWPSGGFHGFTAAAAAVAVVPVLLSGWRHSPSRQRRRWLIGAGALLGLALVFSAPVAVSALMAKNPADQGIALARTSLSRIEASDAPSATADLRRSVGYLDTARRRMTGWWDLGGFAVPVVAQQERALYHGTRAGAALATTASRVAGSLDVSSLHVRHGQIDLHAVEALQQPAQQLDQAIIGAQHELSAVPSPWLVAPIATHLHSLDADLTKARRADELALLASRDIPGILGADGTRHYFVAFMSPAETRGLGGFIGAYGILTAQNGTVHLTATGRATQLVNAPASPKLIAPADYRARYGAFSPQTHFEDVTYSPDLPTVEKVIAGLYPQVGGTRIDGVLVLDPYALGALLQFTGPITVPGLSGPLTPQNTADMLLRQQYLTGDPNSAQRHEILQAALHEGFSRLTTGSLPSPKTLSTVLGPEVHQGRLLFWSSHPSDQPLLERVGITGAFPAVGPSSDLLAVTVANAGNSKIDAYLHQHVTDTVQYDPATGRVHSTVAVQLDNAASATGLPPYVIGSYSGSGLPLGTNYSWVTLYSPLRLKRVTIDGNPVTMSSGTEQGVNAYSTYVTIPAQSSAVLTVTLDGSLKAGSRYQMAIRQQPLANPQSFSVQVTPGPGWLYRTGTSGSWVAGLDEIQRHTWSFTR